MSPKRMILFLCALIPLCLCAFAPAIASQQDAFNAVCRVSVSGGIGSGCAFEHSSGCIYVLTCQHVVDRSTAANCEFWIRPNHMGPTVTGQVQRIFGQHDAVVIAIPEAAFGGRLPVCIPIAREFVALNTQLLSVGCPEGRPLTGWYGIAKGYEGADLLFLPGPKQGRSGSPIFDANGTKILGLIRAIDLRSGEGKAVPTAVLFERHTQCDSRYGCQGCQPQPAPQWPTFNAPQQPPVDLTPIANSLNQLNQTIGQLYQQPTPAAPPQPSGPDVMTLQAIQQQAQGLADLKADVPKQIDAAVKPIGEKVEAVNKSLLDHGTLLQRITAAKEQVQQQEPDAPKWRQDLDAMKLTQHSLFTSLATLAVVGIVVVMIGFVIGIIHAVHAHKAAVKAGQPDPTEAKLTAMQQQAQAKNQTDLANAMGQLLAGWKSVEAKIDGQQAQAAPVAPKA